MSLFFFSSRRRHTRFKCDWSSDVCSSDLQAGIWSDRARKERSHARFLRCPDPSGGAHARSEERRVGKECRSRWSPYHYKNLKADKAEPHAQEAKEYKVVAEQR